MKQFGIYIAAIFLMTACANQGNLASYDDDGIYARSGKKKAASANAEDAYYFVDEEPGSEDQKYYGSEDQAIAGEDDYVADAKSLPSESGRAYSSQRYNSPTYYSAYTSHVPVTMRLGYSSFHNPFAYGGGFGISVGYGYGFYDPWWGYYDPWNPWCRPYPWGRSWYSWNTWYPYGYGMGYSAGYANGYHNGYYQGINSYNWNNSWGETAYNSTYHGRRPGFGGGSFGVSSPGNTGPRGRNTFESTGRTATPTGTRTGREFQRSENTRTRTPDRNPTRDNPAIDNRRPANPNATRRPADNNDRPAIRWGNGSRTPDINRGGTQPNRGGVTTPSRGNSYSRPGSSPSRNNSYSRPSSPSRNNSFSRPSSPSRSVSPSGGSSPRNSSGSRGSSNRGGRR